MGAVEKTEPWLGDELGRPARRPVRIPAGPGARAALEVIDRDGHVRQVWPIRAWPAFVGRALDNDIVLGDPHVAAHHFVLDAGEGGAVEVEAGETVNGILVDDVRLARGMRKALAADADTVDFVAGRTRLRLRLAGPALPAEEPLAALAVQHLHVVPTLVLAAVLLGGLAFNTYLESDPDTFGRTLGTTLLIALGGGAIWCGAWALLSKTITRQGHFGWHLRVFVVACLALLAVSVVPGLFAFALSWPWLTDFAFIGTYAVAATALYFHLLAIEPARPRLLRAVIAIGALVGIALTLWFNLQRTGRLGEELYMTHLFPPRLRIAQPMPVEAFVGELAPLRPLLDRKAQERSGAESAGFGDEDKPDDDDD